MPVPMQKIYVQRTFSRVGSYTEMDADHFTEKFNTEAKIKAELDRLEKAYNQACAEGDNERAASMSNESHRLIWWYLDNKANL